MRLLVQEQLPPQVVANRCGVHRATIWRWQRKWLELNQNMELSNRYRPNRTAGTQFRLGSCKWLLPTLSSRPHSSPHAIAEQVVKRVLELRQQLKRCAEVIWHYLT